MNSKRCARIVSRTAISSAPWLGGASTPPIVCRMQWTSVKTDAVRRRIGGLIASNSSAAAAVGDQVGEANPRIRPLRRQVVAGVGGADRDRTGDLVNAIHARSQLR